MQRILSIFFLVAALYVSGLAYATDTVPVQGDKPVPHIALMLPLKSATFGRAAEAVRQGFLAAANSQLQTLPVRVYGCTDESSEIVALYQQAIAGGARAVAGPLTRDGVAVLADYPGITVPTLALNFAEDKDTYKLYFFGLSAEMEARQIARLAASNGLRDASIVSNGAPLSKRLSQAFAEEWKISGGHIAKEILYQDDPAVLADLPATEGNMVFLAADADTAHLIRPYLGSTLPVYATSQLFNGNNDTLTNYDLNDVHFVDMPWLLQPDHPAVMIYPRLNPPLVPDMERLYALGIDAYRLLQIMINNSYQISLPLDGVTGRIRLSGHQFQREAIPAQFWHGLGLTPEEIAAQEAALAAANALEASGIPPTPVSAPVATPEQ
jgi:outer membrane PBP1 activator LpoA protein